MCACSGHMLTDIRNMRNGCVNMCVCVRAYLFALPIYGHEVALSIYSSPAYLPARLEGLVQKIETALWRHILFVSPLLKNMHLTYRNCTVTKDNAVWHGEWCRMLLTVYHMDVLSFSNDLPAWEHSWHQSEAEWYLSKLSAYRWDCSYCIHCN